jgi:hypothetical protein
VASDSATVSVTFLVGAAAGNYTLSFLGGMFDSSICVVEPTASTLPVAVTAQAIPLVGGWGMAALAALIALAAAGVLRTTLAP